MTQMKNYYVSAETWERILEEDLPPRDRMGVNYFKKKIDCEYSLAFSDECPKLKHKEKVDCPVIYGNNPCEMARRCYITVVEDSSPKRGKQIDLGGNIPKKKQQHKVTRKKNKHLVQTQLFRD